MILMPSCTPTSTFTTNRCFDDAVMEQDVSISTTNLAAHYSRVLFAIGVATLLVAFSGCRRGTPPGPAAESAGDGGPQAVRALIASLPIKSGDARIKGLVRWNTGIAGRTLAGEGRIYLIRSGMSRSSETVGRARDDATPRDRSAERRRNLAAASGGKMHMDEFPLLREDETEEFRRGPVWRIDANAGTITLTNNEEWDRAPDPTWTSLRNIRSDSVDGYPRELPPKDLRLKNGSSIPRLAPGMTTYLCTIPNTGLSAIGWIGVGPENPFTGLVGDGNGRLRIAFFDLSTMRQIGPLVETQQIFAVDQTGDYWWIATPDGSSLLVFDTIIIDETLSQRNAPPNPNVLYVFRVAVVPVPPHTLDAPRHGPG